MTYQQANRLKNVFRLFGIEGVIVPVAKLNVRDCVPHVMVPVGQPINLFGVQVGKTIVTI